MALIRAYEINDSGMVATEAYHVINHVDVEKRMKNFDPPPDPSTSNGFTGDIDPTDEADMTEQMGDPVYWKSGYIGTINIMVWASKQARDDGKDPIGYIGSTPTKAGDSYNDLGENMHQVTGVSTKGLDHVIKFFIDMDSSDSHLVQAYNHLKTSSYYSTAVED
jgi:hypothetical protein